VYNGFRNVGGAASCQLPSRLATLAAGGDLLRTSCWVSTLIGSGTNFDRKVGCIEDPVCAIGG
jgi:hypothetical protein